MCSIFCRRGGRGGGGRGGGGGGGDPKCLDRPELAKELLNDVAFREALQRCARDSQKRKGGGPKAPEARGFGRRRTENTYKGWGPLNGKTGAEAIEIRRASVFFLSSYQRMCCFQPQKGIHSAKADSCTHGCFCTPSKVSREADSRLTENFQLKPKGLVATWERSMQTRCCQRWLCLHAAS